MMLPITSCQIKRQVTGVSVYTNEDYHFKFTRPAVFSAVELVENPEDDDECDIFFKDIEGGRVITLSCKFNPNDNFYEYATENGFDKDKITSVNQNTFIYDDRENSEPAYYLISATKRMIFKAEYKYSDKDSADDIAVCDSLAFEFDIYANTPKKNPLLSSEIYLYEDNFSLRIPANASYKLSPEQENEPTAETDENGEEIHTPSPYTSVTAENKYYTASYNISPSETAFLKLSDITEQMALVIDKEHIAEVSGGLVSELSLSKGELLTCAEGNYIFIPFNCTYNGKACYGAYAAGYSQSGYFYEYVYACANDTPSGEAEQFRQMLQSTSFSGNQNQNQNTGE